MACPICANSAVEIYRPFCSKRCADIDLGRWLNGSYIIPGPLLDEISSDEDQRSGSGGGKSDEMGLDTARKHP